VISATSRLSPQASSLQKNRRGFLDRERTLNVQVHLRRETYPPADLAEFQLFATSGRLRALKAAGYALVVATNQPDVGRGEQSLAVVEAMHANSGRSSRRIDTLEVCYDPGGRTLAAPQAEPGMLLATARDLAWTWPAPGWSATAGAISTAVNARACARLHRFWLCGEI